MNVKERVTKYTTILSVLLITGGGAASSVLADDAGYHARDLQQTQEQTGQVLVTGGHIMLGDAMSVTGSGQHKTTRRQTNRGGISGDDELSRSEALWARFERYTEFGR